MTAIAEASAGTQVRRSVVSRIERVQCSSGIETWLVEDQSRPFVMLAFGFRRALSAPPVERPGAVGLMTSSLLEGSRSLPEGAFRSALAEAAIDLFITPGRDHVNGTLRALKSQSAQAFELLGSALREPAFSDAALQRQRSVLMSNLAMQMGQLQNIARDAYGQRALAGHSYGVGVAQVAQSLQTIGRTDIEAAYLSTVSRANAVVVAVGAITAAELAARIDDALGALPLGARAEATPCSVTGLGTLSSLPVPAPHTAIAFGRPAVPSSDPDFPSAQVVMQALGGGMSSRLMVELRHKRGLCYMVQAGLEVAAGLSAIAGATSTPNEKALEAMNLIKLEISKLLESGLSDAEIEDARAFLMGSTKLQLHSSASIAAALLDARLQGEQPDWLETRITRLQDVTRDSINRTIPRLFGDGALCVAMAGSPNPAPT